MLYCSHLFFIFWYFTNFRPTIIIDSNILSLPHLLCRVRPFPAPGPRRPRGEARRLLCVPTVSSRLKSRRTALSHPLRQMNLFGGGLFLWPWGSSAQSASQATAAIGGKTLLIYERFLVTLKNEIFFLKYGFIFLTNFILIPRFHIGNQLLSNFGISRVRHALHS